MILLSLKYSTFITILLTGTLFLFGYAFSFIEKRNSIYIYSTFGSAGILFTGVIGTAIHEIGHLIMCLIFHNKVTNFQLFNFKGYKHEETLGYVSHKYNDRSLYQKAGNFFIGIGPMISGILFILITFRLLLPNVFFTLNISAYLSNLYIINIFYFLKYLVNFSKNLFFALFNIHNFSNTRFYIFIYLMFSVSSHISLSKKDFQNSYVGIFSLFIIIFMIFLLNITFNSSSINLIIIFMRIIIYLFSFLTMGLIFALISLLISYTLFNIKK